jgi:hypothetical protein
LWHILRWNIASSVQSLMQTKILLTSLYFSCCMFVDVALWNLFIIVHKYFLNS